MPISPLLSLVSAALAYAARGWRVFPLQPDGKHPLISRDRGGHGHLDATTDEEQIRDWWSNEPYANIGIATGSISGFVVVDIDTDKGGDDAMVDLEGVHGPLPLTPTARTGGGGRHLLFAVPPGGLRNSNSKIARGIDVRGDGGYIVAAPSTHRSGRTYAWSEYAGPDAPLATMPDWLLERARGGLHSVAAPTSAPASTPAPPVSQMAPRGAEVTDRASRYLARMDPAVSGQNGHGRLFEAACAMVRGFGLSRFDALYLLEREYNPRCQPPWSRRELEHKVDQAAEKSDRTIGYLRDVEPPARALQPARRHTTPQDEDIEREAIQAEAAAAEAAEADDGEAITRARIAIPAEDVRPSIAIVPDLHIIVDAAVGALASDRRIYQRDGALVHVTSSRDQSPTIRPVTLASMRERLTGVAKFYKTGKNGPEHVTPPDNVSSAVLDRGQWATIRSLIGIVEAPVLRPDGSVIHVAGYDEATAFLYLPSCEFPPIPEAPTQADACSSMLTLLDVFADFPYRSPQDRSAVVAALLTILARPAIMGAVPAFLFDATTPGSGKTLQADVVSMIATGRTTAPLRFPEDDDDETEKILSGCAVEGAQIISWDNITSPFGGGPIDKVLTASDRVKLRVLGKTEVPEPRWRAVMLGTGNNITWRGDTHRRMLIAKLEPDSENPEERTDFKHVDLRSYVRAARPQLVAAALTMLRAYVLAGKPEVGCKLWGSFEGWSSLIPRAIVWSGAADPMLCRPAADPDARDDERSAVAMVMTAVERMAGEDGITARGMIDALYPVDRMRGEAAPDGWEDVREAIEALTRCPSGRKPEARRLGETLSKWKRRYVAGKRIEPSGTGRGGVMRWVVR